MKRLYINPITRTIEPKHRSLKAVHISRGDHNSALLRFEIPQIVDGFDMSEATIQIHYANISGNGLYVSKGMSDAIEVVANDDTVTFAWMIPKTATKYAGVLSIGVTFEKYGNIDDKAEEIYSWSTAPYGEIVVCDSYDNSAEATEREYDYLVETCNAIVEASLNGNLKSLFEEVAGEVVKEAEEYRDNAKTSADEAHVSALDSESFAVGGTGTREGEDTDNAMYYCDEAKGYSQKASTSATNAQKAENQAKQYCEEASGIKNDVLNAKNAVETAKSDIEDIQNEVSENVMYSRDNRDDAELFKNAAESFKNEAEGFMASASEQSGIAGNYAKECETAYKNLLKAFEHEVAGTGAIRLEDVNLGMPTAKVECESPVTMYGKNLDPYNPDRVNNNPDTIKSNWDLTGTDNYAWYTLNVPCNANLTLFRDKVVGTFALYEYDADGNQYGNGETLFNTTSNTTKKTQKISKIQGHTYKLRTSKNAVELMAKTATDNSKYFDFWLQVEVGSASEYEEYKNSVELTNLAEVELYSPTTTLIASSDAEIKATYTKDINKTIERLENAIAN